jgi:MFS family permease
MNRKQAVPARPVTKASVGDLVPPRLRAQYFGNRNLMIMLAALLVAPLAGWLIKTGNGWLGQPNLGYQAVFARARSTPGCRSST